MQENRARRDGTRALRKRVLATEAPRNRNRRGIDRVGARFDHAPMRFLSRCFPAFVLFVASLACFAQAPDAGKLLDDARQQIANARAALDAGTVDDAALTELRESMGAIDTHANTLLGELAPRFDAVSARVAELGPAPPKGGEAKDIAAQRADLDKQSKDLLHGLVPVSVPRQLRHRWQQNVRGAEENPAADRSD